MCSLSKCLTVCRSRWSQSARHTLTSTRTSTRPMTRCAVCLAAWVLMVLTPDRGSCGTTFTIGDLAGEWNLHGLISGYPGDLQGWVYGTMTCDPSGAFTQTSTGKTGDDESPVGGKFEITPDGIVTIPGGSGHAGSFHGVMRSNKDTIILTGNDAGGGYFLVIYTRRTDKVVTANLQGRWVFHGLIVGDEIGPAAAWWHGSMTMDSSGNALFDSPLISSRGTGETPMPLRLSVGEGGVVTEHDDPLPLHGAVNTSKDVAVIVDTVVVESVGEVDIPGAMLSISEKQVQGSYTLRDLAGTWYVHGLVSGSSYNEWTGWYHFTWLIDGQGNGSTAPGSYLNSSGETNQSAGGVMSITSDGIITMSNYPTFHGVMNLGKDMWVATMDDGGGGYGLVIAVGRAGDEFDFNADGRVNFIDLALFADHWLN
jgi:hypothetical protein